LYVAVEHFRERRNRATEIDFAACSRNTNPKSTPLKYPSRIARLSGTTHPTAGFQLGTNAEEHITTVSSKVKMAHTHTDPTVKQSVHQPQQDPVGSTGRALTAVNIADAEKHKAATSDPRNIGSISRAGTILRTLSSGPKVSRAYSKRSRNLSGYIPHSDGITCGDPGAPTTSTRTPFSPSITPSPAFTPGPEARAASFGCR